ncbi:MarR family winged helix-turn-helix transcriptional regulator [Oceanibacterium hippocampi]|uniref:HTH-type transcriptional repressor NicR n=1 Tax=Oceanibacterium hippocampi TaxID=745714 RepID=A0A1Y5RSP1_9PROT|nr:MarR family transcriptional regulator [Oceanibacterium hippocampi]SLN24222.1 HTH-type transcriptional repressor NicR [Oceanibacterium hippocampi]
MSATTVGDLYGMPGHLIRRAQQIAVAIFLKACATVDLTPVQYAALVAIRSTPALDATRLSALVAFDRSTLGNVLDRLEGKGLIARGPSPDDRRIKRIALTPAGAQLLDRAEPLVAEAQARILEPFSDGEAALFMRLMTRFVDSHNAASRAPLRRAGGTD